MSYNFFIQLEPFFFPCWCAMHDPWYSGELAQNCTCPNCARPTLCGGPDTPADVSEPTSNDPTVDQSQGFPHCRFRAPSLYFPLFGTYQLLCYVKTYLFVLLSSCSISNSFLSPMRGEATWVLFSASPHCLAQEVIKNRSLRWWMKEWSTTPSRPGTLFAMIVWQSIIHQGMLHELH